MILCRKLLDRLPAIFCLFVMIFATSCSGNKQAKEESHQEKKEQYKIAIVYDSSIKDSEAYGSSAIKGLHLLAHDFNGTVEGYTNADFGNEVFLSIREVRHGQKEYSQIFRSLGEASYDLVFGLGSIFESYLENVSIDFPKTYFVQVDSNHKSRRDKSNLIYADFAENTAAYLMGSFASIKAEQIHQNSRIAYIGTIDNTLSESLFYSFSAGAYKAKHSPLNQNYILSAYVSDTIEEKEKNTEKIKLTISNLIKLGVTVFYCTEIEAMEAILDVTDNTDSIVLCQGFDYSPNSSAFGKKDERERGKSIITSIEKCMDCVIYNIGRDLLSDNINNSTGYIFDFSNGGLDYSKAGLSNNDITILSEYCNDLLQSNSQIPQNSEELQKFSLSIF